MINTNRNNPVELVQGKLLATYNIIEDINNLYTSGEAELELDEMVPDDIHITKLRYDDTFMRDTFIDVLELYNMVLQLGGIQEKNHALLEQLHILDMNGLVMLEYHMPDDEDKLYRAYYPLGALCEPIERYLNNLINTLTIVNKVTETLIKHEDSDAYIPEFNVYKIYIISFLYSLGLSPEYITILASLYLYYEYCTVPDEKAHLDAMMKSNTSE